MAAVCDVSYKCALWLLAGWDCRQKRERGRLNVLRNMLKFLDVLGHHLFFLLLFLDLYHKEKSL